MGYDLEVEMIRLAAQRGLLTAPYVFDVESARRHGWRGRRYPCPPCGPHDVRDNWCQDGDHSRGVGGSGPGNA